MEVRREWDVLKAKRRSCIQEYNSVFSASREQQFSVTDENVKILSSFICMFSKQSFPQHFCMITPDHDSSQILTVDVLMPNHKQLIAQTLV